MCDPAFDHSALGVVDVMLHDECLIIYFFDFIDDLVYFQTSDHCVNDVNIPVYRTPFAKTALSLENSDSFLQR